MRLPRRALVIGAVAIVIALVALAVWVFAGGGTHRGVSTRQQVITVTDGPGRDQQVDLDSTLYVPDGVDAQHPAPAVIGSPWLGREQGRAPATTRSTSRGPATSCCCIQPGGSATRTGQVALDSPDYEVLDVKQLITWLAGQPGVLLDGPDDPRVGLAGRSYGGGISPAHRRLRPAGGRDRAVHHLEQPGHLVAPEHCRAGRCRRVQAAVGRDLLHRRRRGLRPPASHGVPSPAEHGDERHRRIRRRWPCSTGPAPPA